jgi:hypothetical protein
MAISSQFKSVAGIAAELSPDGRTVLTRSEEKTARLWNTARGEPIGAPREHRARIAVMALSPDERRVRTAS